LMEDANSVDVQITCNQLGLAAKDSSNYLVAGLFRNFP